MAISQGDALVFRKSPDIPRSIGSILGSLMSKRMVDTYHLIGIGID